MNPTFPVIFLLLASTTGVSAQAKTDANVLVPAQQNATKRAQTAGTCVVDGMQNATLAAAIACTGDHGVVRIPMFAVPELTANITVPAGVVLRFDGASPGIIRLGNFDLTINGPLDAPRNANLQLHGNRHRIVWTNCLRRSLSGMVRRKR
jgi:hypothetical protein